MPTVRPFPLRPRFWKWQRRHLDPTPLDAKKASVLTKCQSGTSRSQRGSSHGWDLETRQGCHHPILGTTLHGAPPFACTQREGTTATLCSKICERNATGDSGVWCFLSFWFTFIGPSPRNGEWVVHYQAAVGCREDLKLNSGETRWLTIHGIIAKQISVRGERVPYKSAVRFI